MRAINRRGRAIVSALQATAVLALGQTAITLIAVSEGMPSLSIGQLANNLMLTAGIGAGLIGLIILATRRDNA